MSDYLQVLAKREGRAVFLHAGGRMMRLSVNKDGDDVLVVSRLDGEGDSETWRYFRVMTVGPVAELMALGIDWLNGEWTTWGEAQAQPYFYDAFLTSEANNAPVFEMEATA